LRSARAVFDVVVVSIELLPDVVLPEFEAVEPLVSVDELPAVLGELDDAPMLDVPVEPAVPEFDVVPLAEVPELPAVLGLVELFDVDGLLVDEDVDGLALELEPLEVWPMARPTLPARPAAIANVVRVFLVALIYRTPSE
jgi:hypothetical protein